MDNIYDDVLTDDVSNLMWRFEDLLRFWLNVDFDKTKFVSLAISRRIYECASNIKDGFREEIVHITPTGLVESFEPSGEYAETLQNLIEDAYRCCYE